ncbi:hypothetical protein EG329_012932 [Mollisiaceae sp. DMI_Dod_QoI]|nr:hypothetical protein EG329_012932 [Helotiales sp. DMI_Dod_QoI]
MAELSNNPYKAHHDVDMEANLLLPSASPLPSPNPFLDPPNAPPPAYNFHAQEGTSLILPPHTTLSSSYPLSHNHNHNQSRSPSPSPYPSRSPSPYLSPRPAPSPFKRQESPSAAYHRKQQYNRRRFICFLIAVIVMIVIALVVAGVAFKWGKNNICVRWEDGSESGNCD